MLTVFTAQEAPKYSAEVRSWGLDGSDAEVVQTFNLEILTHLEKILQESGHLAVKERTVGIAGRQTAAPGLELISNAPHTPSLIARINHLNLPRISSRSLVTSLFRDHLSAPRSLIRSVRGLFGSLNATST